MADEDPKPQETEKKEAKKEKKTRGLGALRRKEKNTAPAIAKADFDPYDVLQFVLMTEKAVRMVELQNKLVFMVEKRTNKKKIRQAVEAAFNSPVAGVQTMFDETGRKKAFVKFRNAGAAGDIAVRLGII